MRFKNFVLEQASQGVLWKDQRFEYYNNGNLKYRGAAKEHDVRTDLYNQWEIWKYTWDGDDVIRIEGPLSANWDDRDDLQWSIL